MKLEKLTLLTNKEKAFFREKLQGMLEKLFVESGQTVKEMKSGYQEFPDPTDRANYESERNTTLRIRDRERKLIKKIHGALKRLENDEYNVCQECGVSISKERLKARPVTTLCIDCKEMEEQKEKIQYS